MRAPSVTDARARLAALTAIVAVTAAALLAPAPSSAAPRLTVTGRARLRLTRVSRTADRKVLIRGDLRDASLNTGVPRQRLLVGVRVRQRVVARARVRTDDQGAFEVKLALPRGTYHVQVRFPGSRVFAPVSVRAENLDVSKLAAAIGIDIASELDVASARHRVPLVATVDGQPVDVAIALFKLVAGKATRLGAVRTGRKGRAALTIQTRDLGRPGPLTLEARFAGSAEINAASTRREVVLVAPVTLTLRARQREVEADGRIELRGTARDLAGPLANASIAIHGQGRHLASVRADRAGRFVARLSAAAFPPGQLEMVARFTPSVVWRKHARSKPVQVRVRPVTPIPARAYLIPAGATLLVVTLLLAVRYRDRLFPSQPAATKPSRTRGDDSDSDLEGAPPPPLVSGLEAGAPKRRALRAQHLDLAGLVWDAADEQPIAGADIIVRAPGARGRADTDADSSAHAPVAVAQSNASGRFSIDALPAGRHVVEVTKLGFMPERFDIEVPHRGQLSAVRVRMVPVRVRILEVYREVAFPLLPKPTLWARWTPRDLLRHVRQASRTPSERARDTPLSRLSALFEAAYWGASAVPHTRVADARDLAVAVRAERDAATESATAEKDRAGDPTDEA